MWAIHICGSNDTWWMDEDEYGTAEEAREAAEGLIGTIHKPRAAYIICGSGVSAWYQWLDTETGEWGPRVPAVSLQMKILLALVSAAVFLTFIALFM